MKWQRGVVGGDRSARGNIAEFSISARCILESPLQRLRALGVDEVPQRLRSRAYEVDEREEVTVESYNQVQASLGVSLVVTGPAGCVQEAADVSQTVLQRSRAPTDAIRGSRGATTFQPDGWSRPDA